MSKKHKNEIRLFCISKCNHMSVYDLLNNTVICSKDTVKSNRIDQSDMNHTAGEQSGHGLI